MIDKRGLKLTHMRKSPGLDQNTVMAWASGDSYGQRFVAFGRIVRHDERPLLRAAARLGWSRYETAAGTAVSDRARQPESSAVYTLDDIELGQGVAGFAKAMDRLAALPEGSVVQVRVCLRTQGPFVCPLIYEGYRHFERTGYEPYCGMFPWLIDVARKRQLDVQWVPDEQPSCLACELNR